MADTIFTSQTPETDDSGGVTNRSVGMRFQISSSGKASTTARYWVPSAGLGATTLFYIWNLTGSTRLVEVDLNSVLSSPTTNAWNSFSLGTTISWATSTNYAVGVYLDGSSHYLFSDGQTLPFTSGGAISADTSIFRENGTHDDAPNNTGFAGGVFFSDVDVVDASVSGTAVIILGGLTATAAGTRTVNGTVAKTLGGLTGTAAGLRTVLGAVSKNLGALTGTASGTRTVFGTANASLGGLSGTSAGTRTVLGAAAITLGGLNGTTAGVRTVLGAMAATLAGLTATARGAQTVTGTASASLGGVTATIVVVTAAPVVDGGGWYGLLSIIEEAKQIAAEERSAPRVACDCGEPLETGPRGELHCKFDGRLWS